MVILIRIIVISTNIGYNKHDEIFDKEKNINVNILDYYTPGDYSWE